MTLLSPCLLPCVLAGVLCSAAPKTAAGTIYSFTYMGEAGVSRMEPISFDADSLAIVQGSPLNGSLATSTDMAVDETGRLFGYKGSPGSLLNSTPSPSRSSILP